MAHNPQAPQGPEGNHDPAGSTQMFRAYVNESGAPAGHGPAAPAAPRPSGGGPRIGLIVGVIVVIAVVAVVAWLALG